MNLAPNHCADVAAGIYDLPIDFKQGKPDSGPPTVLDIGANVGAYSRWASARWPGCKVLAFEPHPENFEMFLDLIRECGLSNVEANNLAIGRADDTARLYEGRNNCGECSLERGPEQTDHSIEVTVLDAALLPPAHIIKIDTEGAEIPILERLYELDRINQPIGYSLEFHSAEDRRRIDTLLAHYTLMSGTIYGPTRGVLNYLRTDLINHG